MGIFDMLDLGPHGDRERILPFVSRADAGRKLALALQPHADRGALVLGIPRGGVEIAAPVAAHLHATLDVIVARKLGAPLHAELAIGAVTPDGSRYLDTDTIARLGVTGHYLDQVTHEEIDEARRRERRFRGERPSPRMHDRIVIVVDDGLATGATMFAALEAVRRHQPQRLVVAVPVGSREACTALREVADEVVCLAQPEPFHAVGVYYWNFPQLSDAEVVDILDEAESSGPPRGGPGQG